MEVWVKVKPELYPAGKFNQTYSISNHGNVRNDKTGRLLKARPDQKGYLRVNLATRDFKIHRLVALHFVPNDDPDNKTMVNHKDGVKANNLEDNLEWCTAKHNSKHAADMGLINHKGERNSRARISDDEMLAIWDNGLDTHEIVKLYNVSKPHASRIKNKHVRQYLLEGKKTCND
ncbi:NUMOD4 motif protein [Bacillus phage Eldridge]|uniref:NUMOD4 motif protein n=1 Tax=Bacillus phage Eldridge TaxID=1776293 RepID=A0A0Y0C565_9CAUD|nr:NUMOD4 motif protein [Bacillus phage Eldridge]AMB18690.1 NUMOD4 motif protein [Bacillus phage Eldridge]